MQVSLDLIAGARYDVVNLGIDMKIYVLVILLLFNVGLYSGIGCIPSWKEQSLSAQNIGFRLLRDGSEKEAIAEFRRALKADPYLLHANRLLGELLMTKEGDLFAAVPFFSRYCDLHPGDAATVPTDLLEKIVAGEVEEPTVALNAVLWAIRNDFALLLSHRIDGRCSEAEIQMIKKIAQHPFRMVRFSLRNDVVILTVSFSAESKPVRFYLCLNPSGTWSLVNASAV